MKLKLYNNKNTPRVTEKEKKMYKTERERERKKKEINRQRIKTIKKQKI